MRGAATEFGRLAAAALATRFAEVAAPTAVPADGECFASGVLDHRIPSGFDALNISPRTTLKLAIAPIWQAIFRSNRGAWTGGAGMLNLPITAEN